MTISVYIPLLLSLVLAALSRPLARWLSPRTAAPALVIAAGLSAAASTWGLILLAATLLHQAPPVAERAATGTHLPSEPVPGLIAAAPGAVLAVGAYRLTEVIKGRRATHRTLRGLCEPSEAAELVVIAASAPHAVAVPGRGGNHGRILVTSGMLAALDHDERAVLLAHERAHLRERHHWLRAVVDAAAAVNPLLRPARDTVAFLLERCADEAAADTVGSRTLAARSLVRAALATTDATRGEALAFQRLAITTRVAALQVAAPPPRPLIAAAVVLIGVLTTLLAGDATVAFVELVERFLPGGS